MVRKMKINIHIYFPEASHRGNNVDICECFYLKHTYQRRLKGAQLRYYAEAHEKNFLKAIKDKEKRKNNAENDQFFIVLDTDILANKGNVNEVKSQFIELAKRYKDKAKIIVSSRSFEVWLCMFDREIYTKPYESQNQLNKEVFGNYVKKEEWYRENSQKLYNQFQRAKEASIRSKKHVFQTTDSAPPVNNLEIKLPDFTEYIVTNYLVETTPFTYFEHLIDVLNEYE